MNIYVVNVNTKLAAMYYNVEKPNLFRVHVDVTLSNMNDQLDQINSRLNHRDTRRINNVQYRHPSVDSDGRVRCTLMKLQNNEIARTMFSIYGQCSSRGPIELDASFV